MNNFLAETIIRARVERILTTRRELKRLERLRRELLTVQSWSPAAMSTRPHGWLETYYSLNMSELDEDIRLLRDRLNRLRRNYTLSRLIGTYGEATLSTALGINRDTEVKVIVPDPFSIWNLPEADRNPETYYRDKPEDPQTDYITLQKHILPDDRVVYAGYSPKFNRLLIREGA